MTKSTHQLAYKAGGVIYYVDLYDEATLDNYAIRVDGATLYAPIGALPSSEMDHARIRIYCAGTVKFSAPLYIAGYILGGLTSGAVATIAKFRFYNKTRSNLAATLSQARYGGTGVHSEYYGYIIGGSTGSANVQTTDKLGFATELCASIGTGLTIAMAYSAGFSGIFSGYTIGGYTNTNLNTISRLSYSDDSAVVPVAYMMSGGRSLMGSAEPGKCGYPNPRVYYAGGYSTNAPLNIIGVFDEATETAMDIDATLASARYYPTGVGSETAVYFAGGYIDQLESGFSSIEAYDISTLARRTLGATLSRGGRGSAGFRSLTSGYFAGGYMYPTTYAHIDALLYATETRTTESATLGVATRESAAVTSTVR